MYEKGLEQSLAHWKNSVNVTYFYYYNRYYRCILVSKVLGQVLKVAVRRAQPDAALESVPLFIQWVQS